MKNSTFSAVMANNLLTLLQGYSKTIRLLLVMFVALTVNANAWADTHTIGWGSATGTAGTFTNFTAVSGTVTNVVSFSTAKNSASSAPAYNSSSKELRLYYGSSGNGSSGNGCSITLTPTTGVTITAVKITASSTSYTPTVKYNVNGGTDITGTWSSTTMTISGINATTALKIRNANTSNKQLRIKTIQITYTAAASCTPITPSLSYAPSSLSVGGTANPTLSGNTGKGTVTYTSSNTSVATINASTGVVTAKAAGKTTITANIAANNGYCEGTATAQITVTPDPYTVILNAGSGTCAASVTEASAGAGVTLPTPTLDCGDWDFAGWATSAVSTETTTKPTLIAAGAYSPTSDITLYAVYQRTEGGGGGGGSEVTFNFGYKDWGKDASFSGTTYSTVEQNNNGVSVTYTRNDGSLYANTTSLRLYKTNTLTFDAGSNTITSITFTGNIGQSDITTNAETCTNSTNTLSWAGSSKSVTFTRPSNASSYATLTSATLTIGGGSTTYYHSTPDCAAGDPCDALQAPNVTATATAYSITLSWDAVDGATSYNVYNYTTDEAEEVNVLTYTFNGLDPETEYEWGIESAKDECFKETRGTTTTQKVCTDAVNVIKGTPSNGSFTMVSGYQSTCNGPVTVTLSNIEPATGYQFSAITQSGVDAAKVTIDNTAKTVTYAKNTTGTSTINVTFIEIPNYTVTLNPNYPTGKTGVFKDKEGNIINGNLEVLLPSGTASQALTNFYSSIELDNYAFDGFYTQAEGGSKRVNTGDITGNITFYAHWKEKYTITWSVNGNTALIEPTTFAAGDNTWEMPTTDYDCSGKGFVGWTTNPIIAAQDEAPDPLYTNASQFPNATATYHAVFAEGGSGGSGGYKKLTEALDDYSGEYLIVYETDKVAFNGGLTTLDATSNYISVTITDGVIASNATTDAAKFTFAKVDGGYSILSASGKYIGREATSNGLNATSTYAAGYLNTITYNSIKGKGGPSLKYNNANDQKRFRYFASGQQAIALYKKSGSSATYTAYTTSCVASFSITYDFAGGTASHCSNTSVPQGDTYTICDDAPTKEGNTFLHWSDGKSTYAAGATFTPTGDVTLTAVWKANTYTVTWNNNGDTDEVTYNHGDALVVPTTPASCDGVKEFVGWTTHSGYYHATTAPDDIFTTKTTPVTATATYYAVFATPGAGGTEFVLGESGTFKMYANVDGTNHYAQGGVSSSKLSSTTDILTASDYTLTHKGSNQYTIQIGNSYIGHRNSSSTDLYTDTEETTWTITEGVNGSWRIVSPVNASRALVYRTSTYNIFKAYSTASLEAGNTEYFDIEFGSGSNAYSDYTTICQTVESIEIANYTTEFFVTDEFAFGGTVTAHFDGGGTQDVTALAHFSGYNMNVTGTYTVTVTYMGATATYEINVKPLHNAWVLTWNVSGKTNTGLGPRSVTKGSAIGTLPTPIVPDACEGKTFMGWTESNVVNSDGSGITYITKDTKPTDNTTYYAVFATVNNFCTQKPINQIASGSKVVIVAVASLTDDGGAGKAISSRATDDTYNLQGDDVAIYDQTINTPHKTCIWTINKEGEKYVFTQDGKYLNAIKVDSHYNLKYNDTKDTWSLTSVAGKENTYRMQSTNTAYFAEFYTGKFTLYKEANDQGEFDMQFFVTANANGEADITDYTTGCAEYTITYYGFQGGYSTSCSSDGTIVLPVNSLHTIPNCGDVVKDHTNLNRTFTGVWMTQPHGGHTFKPGDTFILTQDTTLYAQWKLNTQNDFTTLPTDVEDLAGTDIYVYGGKTLTLQPGTTTINSLTLKGGIQTDGSYQMPSVWVPEGATLVRNSNKIYLDLVVNAENWYPFAVPFETKNTSDIHYLHPDMKSAAKYSKHFDIKTYDGARRADVGEDKANNWVRLKRHTAEEPVSFKPGVGYIISAMAYPGTDTATIRIPMTVPNTWFKNGEQAVVGTTVRNTIAVTAHTGEATDINNGGHQRHAGWNFVANPYLSNFTGGGIDATNGLDYIDGVLIIQGSYEYDDETVPYVTIPAYNFAYYSQHKLSDVKLSPEWSFFVQVGTSGTMDFTTTGRQQAPASIAARAEERPVKMDVDLILSDNHSSDQTGIIISDRYNDTYEIGRDLEKLFGSAYNLSVYTLMADNTPLAFQALAIRSNMQVIPVGYRAPEQGEYTFRLNEATSSIDLLNEQYEQLVLVDYQTGELTNLLISDYTFYSERTQADNRFAIYAVPRQNAPTDLPNAIGQDKEAQKIIHNGHLYILRDGNVYNGNGQIVK